MAGAAGPDISQDGIVLALDAASIKSFKGEPTTNVVTNWNLDTGWSKGYTEDIVFNEIPPPPGVNAPTVGFRNDDTSGDGYWYSYGNYAPQDSSTTYTISVYAKTNQTDDRFFLRAYTADNSENGRHWTNGIYLTAADGWKRIVWPSFTTIANNQSDSLSFRYDNLYQNGYTRLWLCAPQMEAKSYATPFVAGTRGTTVATGGGWADLSGNDLHGEILNGTTTDSSRLGSLSFDGTDDYISLGNPATLQFTYTDPFTLEAWINPDSITAGFRHIIGKTYGNYRMALNNAGITFRLDQNNLSIQGGSLTAGNWHHVVSTWNPGTSTAKVYVNGTQVASGTNATVDWTNTTANFQLGNSPGENYYFPGKIASGKAYSRVLTDLEILDNYNGLKSRFGV